MINFVFGVFFGFLVLFGTDNNQWLGGASSVLMMTLLNIEDFLRDINKKMKE